jgi:DNA-binding CsgD family transcriptional regulator
MWDYLKECGEAPDLRGMLRSAAGGLPRILPCEHAIACLAVADPAQDKVSVSVEHTGAPQKAVSAYCERYFSQDIARLHMDVSTLTYQMDWRQSKLVDEPFVREFIHGLLRIDFSAGIPMFDADGSGGLNICLTRLGMAKASSRDEAILLALRPHLVNLYSLFKRAEQFPADRIFAAELAGANALLSRREAEIAGLLCRRLHAREIATLLLISRRTVETHVQHIYDKLRVNNRAELLHRLMG